MSDLISLARPMSTAGFIKSLVHFAVFTSLYIAGCAILMINQTNELLALEYDIRDYFLFVFFSTICSYNFHWGLSTPMETKLPRLRWTLKNKVLHAVLCLIGAVGAAIYFIHFIDQWFWLCIGVLLTFLYSAPKVPLKPFLLLRKIAVGKTLFLAMVWMYVTTALPILLSGKQWDLAAVLFCISRFFLIYAICILFDYRDREYDKQQGIRSLITYLNENGVNLLFFISMLIFFISNISLYWYHFSVLMVSLLILPGIIVIALYKTAKRNFSDYLYYIVLDGMMMLSALITSVLHLKNF
jgi:4-hydroxybenzoate polyprenyltransferase